jgi:hypothetical protein
MRTGPFGSQYCVHGSVVRCGSANGAVGGTSDSIFLQRPRLIRDVGLLPRSLASTSTLLMLWIGPPRTHAPERSGTGDGFRPAGGPSGRKFFNEARFAGGPIGAGPCAVEPDEAIAIDASMQARR